MALSPRPWVALVALVALAGPSVASKRQLCRVSRGDRAALARGEPPELGAVTVTNGEPWGQWGFPQFCPPGAFASGFRLKVQPHQGFFRDDTGLNGVQLICDNSTDTVTSSVGLYGSWESAVLCPQGEFLTSFRLRVEPSVGIRDDTAATDMEATCAGGLVLQGKGLPWGEWGPWSRSCGSSCHVCGIRTRVDLHHFFDTKGLTDLRLYCCPHEGYGWGQPGTP